MGNKKIYVIAGVLLLAAVIYFATSSSSLFQGRLSNKMSEGRDSSTAQVTRDKLFGELVKIKIETLSSTEKANAMEALKTSSGCFDDIVGNTYESYICYGKSKSWDFIYNHDGADKNFYPKEKIPRNDATWYVLRMFYSDGQAIEDVPSKNLYSDVNDVIFLADYIESLSVRGIFEGDVELGGAFKPFDNITQGSFAKWTANLKTDLGL